MTQSNYSRSGEFLDLSHPCKPCAGTTRARRSVHIPDSEMKPQVLIFNEKSPTTAGVYVKLSLSPCCWEFGPALMAEMEGLNHWRHSVSV